MFHKVPRVNDWWDFAGRVGLGLMVGFRWRFAGMGDAGMVVGWMKGRCSLLEGMGGMELCWKGM